MDGRWDGRPLVQRCENESKNVRPYRYEANIYGHNNDSTGNFEVGMITFIPVRKTTNISEDKRNLKTFSV